MRDWHAFGARRTLDLIPEKPTMRTQRCARTLTASVFLAAALACDDPTGPSVEAVAGTYTATQLTTTEGGTITNQLAAGASITLTLNANGTTSGRFIVPGAPEEDLTGTWTLRGSIVNLSHSADTFLRDTAFQVRGNTLVGDETFASWTATVRVRVTLTKQ
jgi:hypothetical protein